MLSLSGLLQVTWRNKINMRIAKIYNQECISANIPLQYQFFVCLFCAVHWLSLFLYKVSHCFCLACNRKVLFFFHCRYLFIYECLQLTVGLRYCLVIGILLSKMEPKLLQRKNGKKYSLLLHSNFVIYFERF